MLLLHLSMKIGSEAFNNMLRATARDGFHTSHCTTLFGHRSHGNLESSDVCCEALGIEVRTQTDLGPLVSTFENRCITPPSRGHCKHKKKPEPLVRMAGGVENQVSYPLFCLYRFKAETSAINSAVKKWKSKHTTESGLWRVSEQCSVSGTRVYLPDPFMMASQP